MLHIEVLNVLLIYSVSVQGPPPHKRSIYNGSNVNIHNGIDVTVLRTARHIRGGIVARSLTYTLRLMLEKCYMHRKRYCNMYVLGCNCANSLSRPSGLGSRVTQRRGGTVLGGKGEAKKAMVAARPGAATRAVLVNARESALSMACGSKASWRRAWQ